MKTLNWYYWEILMSTTIGDQRPSHVYKHSRVRFYLNSLSRRQLELRKLLNQRVRIIKRVHSGPKWSHG